MNPPRRRAFTRRDTLRLSLGSALATMGTAGSADAAPATAPASSADSGPAPDPVRTRMLWTWDHSTEWLLNHPGAQTIGAANHYSRTTEWFLEDFTRLLEYCGRHHIDAVVVWGLLRDHHGGLESAKRLCDIAEKNGVRLLCGAGLCAYGGVYYEGDSPYSLDLLLKKKPELKALNETGGPLEFSARVYGAKTFYHACPSRREMHEHIADSLRWLFQNLPLAGVQIESGDTGVCHCKACGERRHHPVGRFSWEDMALLYPIAIEAVRSVKPDAWICCETYSHPEPYQGPEPHPGFSDGRTAWADACLDRIPEGVFIQWVYDQLGKGKPLRVWTQGGNLDARRHRHIMRAHFSTYWTGLRGEPAVEAIARMVQDSTAHGSDAICLFGEVSPFHTGAELNYGALENFGSAVNPNANLDVFLRDVAAPLLGGESQARDWLRLAGMRREKTSIPPALEEIYKRCGSLPPAAARRWAWLATFLASCLEA